jgi:hypothetical protein
MPSSSQKPSRLRCAGLSILEMLVAGAVLTIFAVGANYSMLTFNRNATVTRNYAAAQAMVRDYTDQALAADYTSTATAPILTVTAAGTDIDGDGEADGVLFDPADPVSGTNYTLPLVYKRDSAAAYVQQSVVTGQIYRRVRLVDATLKILEVNFLLKFTYRGKNYFTRMAALKAQDER